MNMTPNTASPVTSAAQADPKSTSAQAAAPATRKAAPAKKATAPAKAAQKVQTVKPAAPKPVVKAPVKPTAKEAPVVKKQAAAVAKPVKDKKVKVVRDSFTIPKTELLQIGDMKKRALTLGVEIKKSELIRAGLSALSGMSDTAFKKAIASVPTIKTGRPAKE